MVELVPDDYFPEEQVGGGEQDALYVAISLSLADIYNYFQMISSFYTPFVSFGSPLNSTLREALDSVTFLMKSGDLQGAIDVVEREGLYIDLVAANGTLLAIGVNVFLSFIIVPVFKVLETFFIDKITYIFAIMPQRPLEVLNATENSFLAVEVNKNNTETQNTSFSFLWGNFFFSFFVDTFMKSSAEGQMLFVCLLLFFLLLIVYVRFEKYAFMFNELIACGKDVTVGDKIECGRKTHELPNFAFSSKKKKVKK